MEGGRAQSSLGAGLRVLGSPSRSFPRPQARPRSRLAAARAYGRSSYSHGREVPVWAQSGSDSPPLPVQALVAAHGSARPASLFRLVLLVASSCGLTAPDPLEPNASWRRPWRPLPAPACHGGAHSNPFRASGLTSYFRLVAASPEVTGNTPSAMRRSASLNASAAPCGMDMALSRVRQVA